MFYLDNTGEIRARTLTAEEMAYPIKSNIEQQPNTIIENKPDIDPHDKKRERLRLDDIVKRKFSKLMNAKK